MLSSLKYKTAHAGLWRLVGHTPMIRIGYRYGGGAEQFILVKCEQYNLTGSIKDRMALYILEKAAEEGRIEPGDLIVEATSGNTGIALSAIGRALGHRVKIFMPSWMSLERQSIMKSYGAELQLVSHEEGGFLGSISLAEAMQELPHVFLPRQFENRYNVEAHEQTTGQEIIRQLKAANIRAHAFVAGVGTGGTVMGVGNALRNAFARVRVHPLEPAESPTLSTGYKNGKHRIQGISDDFIPAIVDLQSLDRIIRVNDGDAILMAQLLGKELGLAVGISSGANLLGAMKLQLEMPGSHIVTVFADSNKKYISTDLFRNEPVLPGYLTPEIQLTGYQPL